MIIKRHLLLYITIFICSIGYSQNESANWYFGEFAGLDFNSGIPVALDDSQLYTNEGCATISDSDGNLLFYTDGNKVWNKNHQLMPNGSDLLGHSSSTMSALIIPKPGNPNSYYIFTVDKPSYYLTQGQPIDGVNYSEVDMTLDYGNGDIVIGNKNVHLVTYNTNDTEENTYKSSEKITAVTHSDGSTVWVITQFINKFYAFKVDTTGVNAIPIISMVQQSVYPKFNDEGANITAIGYMKVSPNGKKLAVAHSSTSVGSPSTGTKRSGKILLYDFNNSTGQVSNQVTLIENTYPYGLEFSPNSKLLYATVSNFNTEDVLIDSNLFQYNTESSNVANSKLSINTSTNAAGALQLAIDGKIYRAGYPIFSTSHFLSVINSPNTIGSGCGYSHNSIPLENGIAELGLPPFVQSIFNYTFDYEFTCIGDTTHFTITSEDPYDTVLWDFGDGQTSTDEEAFHTYNQSGTYSVSLHLTLNSITNDPMVKQIKISEPPQVLPTTYQLIQCDSFDEIDDDGLTIFNLESANGPLTYHTTEPIEVLYYHSLADAENDVSNTDALNPIYNNQIQGEILYAKVFKANTDCYSMASIQLLTSTSSLFEYALESCDIDNDGEATFDLNGIRQTIVTDLNFPNNTIITFHESTNDAALNLNMLPDSYTSENTTLYIRAENNNICYGYGQLNLVITSFPTIEDQTINVCESDFPIEIYSGLPENQIDQFTFLWNTNQTTNSVLIYEPGIYNVNISSPIVGCEKTISITVNQNDIATVESIDINDYTAIINLANPIENFEFAVDDSNFQSYNIFTNLTPGEHIAYIKDVYNCHIISQSFLVIGFPKYFTPNNDGINDTWNIKGLDENLYPNVIIHIFNRYGKLLQSFNPNQSLGWNGTYNKKLLTPDDYWYYIKLPDGKTYKGHFSLKI